MELIAILKELGLPAIGIAGMLMVYFWSSKKMERKIDAVKKDVEVIQQNVEDLSMESLKSRITNKELPNYARVAAYDEYKRKGGNSWIDIYVREEGLTESAR